MKENLKEKKRKKKPTCKIGKEMEWKEVDQWVETYKKYNKGCTHGWLYGKDLLKKMLKNDECDGIWFFKGYDDEGNEKLVLYPADEDGRILRRSFKSLGAKEGPHPKPGDAGQECPPECP